MNRESLKSLFLSDNEFINKYNDYHSDIPSNIEAITDDNWNKIKDLRIIDTEYGYFAIDDKSDLIPWVVGFFVLPKYRKNNSLEEDMKRETNGMFMVSVSNTNIRALKFIRKFAKQTKEDSMKTTFYVKRGI